MSFVFGVIPDPDRMPEVDHFFERSNFTRLRERYTELARIEKDYDGHVRPLSANLSRFAGQTVRPVVIAEAGASSGQDWAAWMRPVIDARREITIAGIQCILESTSGWSDFRRRRRRSWSSDEFALFVQVIGLDERGDNVLYDRSQYRATTSVDSGESFTFLPMTFAFAPSEVRQVEVRMVGLEIDGAGETDYLARTAFNSWAGTTYFPGDGTRYSFNTAFYGPRGGNDHNLLAADYWRMDPDRMLSGGVEPSTVYVPPGRPLADVATYLGEVGITRGIARASLDDVTIESRRYQSGPHYSDYLVNISYR